MRKARYIRPLTTDDIRYIRSCDAADERLLCDMFDRSRSAIHLIRKRGMYKYVPDDPSHPDESDAALRMTAYPNHRKGAQPTAETWQTVKAEYNRRSTADDKRTLSAIDRVLSHVKRDA